MSVVAASQGRSRRVITKAYRIAIGVYIGLCGVMAVLAAIPLRSEAIRLALVGGIFGVWAGALFLFWDRIFVRIICFALALAAGGLIFLPMLPIQADTLRAEYVRSLQSYSGTPYLWGGETHLGIDCSGLVRAGLMDAETEEGIRTRNLVLLRKAASLWWNDCSADALAREFQGRTHHILDAPSLNEADYSKIQPGDMAIVANGKHILAYTGDKTWIEADPGPMKVVSVQIPSKEGWFAQRARIMRWRILEPTAPAVEPR